MASSKTISGIHYEIMKRCYNKKSIMYCNYGGKGISVCDEWHNKDTFRQWCLNNGYKTGIKLKRKDSSADYCPNNCFFSFNPIYIPKTYHKKDSVPEYIKKQKEREKHNKIRESYGVPKKFSKTKIYKVYRSMVSRCTPHKETNKTYKICNKYYSGRGIKVCDEWQGRIGFYRFYQWSMENGYKEGLSLDRINNDKGYSPDNCRWIPFKIQERNKRNNVRYNYHGENLLLIEICEKENISYDALKYRVAKQGQELDYAISEIRKHRIRTDELFNPKTNPTGCLVRSLRKKTGLTQKEFAVQYSIPESTIQEWECGNKIPNKDKLNSIIEKVDSEYINKDIS